MQKRCLLVDDAVDVRTLISLGLVRAGFEVVAEAGNAAQALAAARTEQPAIVLVDLMLPDSDGLKTIADLRHILPDATIMACSGMPADSVASACHEAGADHYLEKTRLLEIGIAVAALLHDALP